MAYKTLPNAPGVKVYDSWQDAKADGQIDKVEEGADGNLYATPHQGWLLDNMPWLVLGTMGYGAVAGALPAASTSLGSFGAPAAVSSPWMGAPVVGAQIAAPLAAAGAPLVSAAVPAGLSVPTVTSAPAVASGVKNMGFASSLLKGLTGNIGQQAIATGGQLASNIIGAKAGSKAADAQLQATREALEWEKAQQAKYETQFEPYRLAGMTALSALGNTQAPQPIRPEDIRAWGGTGGVQVAPGQQAPAYTSPSATVRPQSTPLSAMTPGRVIGPNVVSAAQPAAQTPAQVQMVAMRSPSGSVKSVPSNEVPHWQSLGATVMG